ncbi:uncharacterized protein LACBIDRAFT_322469 [Laccaria bicolor S238N-H82]|uniref:Predicted protein n=1 Tax=Laccaria bicolor (strain S238N-H82 / ATCC MYA-4686) TaxID=486041 RepID=B0CWE5_LACBS|nr:uncharacterized protein LACBIDRAFT_322469 [Laccaria bicolor S238N-H82]EDR13495.1 predicted protein [Laccaria bicolor S238N-H82]|eukprot:XP_001875993.1 predicted protein [Laccaria bicolor S238N-H82]
MKCLEVQSQDWKKTKTELNPDCPRQEIFRTVKDHNRGPVFSLSQFRKFRDQRKTGLTGLNRKSRQCAATTPRHATTTHMTWQPPHNTMITRRPNTTTTKTTTWPQHNNNMTEDEADDDDRCGNHTANSDICHHSSSSFIQYHVANSDVATKQM